MPFTTAFHGIIQYMAKPRTKPTYKQKLFAQKYIEYKGNGTKAALAVYNTSTVQTAQVMASENLLKPIVINEIQKLMIQKGITIDAVLKIAERNMVQDEHYPTSQKSAETFMELYGIKRQETAPHQVNILNVFNDGRAQEIARRIMETKEKEA